MDKRIGQVRSKGGALMLRPGLACDWEATGAKYRTPMYRSALTPQSHGTEPSE